MNEKEEAWRDALRHTNYKTGKCIKHNGLLYINKYNKICQTMPNVFIFSLEQFLVFHLFIYFSSDSHANPIFGCWMKKN